MALPRSAMVLLGRAIVLLVCRAEIGYDTIQIGYGATETGCGATSVRCAVLRWARVLPAFHTAWMEQMVSLFNDCSEVRGQFNRKTLRSSYKLY
eukprot:2724634-Rhodomonas_salina.1